MTYQFETSVIETDGNRPLNHLAKTASQVTATLVIEVRKQATHGPSSMICTGRASNNDIVFAHKTISKLHAYFLKTGTMDAYEIVDADSTNGTKVNNNKLTAHQHHPVANRDRIHFGPSIQVMYLTALGFYDFLQELLRCGIF
jgi:pSer/pThr/pTyr-binding forkhead associated (FHA) protein